MIKTKVISNFLIKPLFTALKDAVEGNVLEWFWHSKTLEQNTINPYTFREDDFMFVHVLYSKKGKKSKASKWFSIFEPILYFLKDKYDYKELIRVKMNLYVNQGKQYEHPKHIDFYDQSTNQPPNGLITSIFNFTTCDGYTKIGDEKIPSRENELIMFDGSKEHCGSTPTNTKNRVVININVI